MKIMSVFGTRPEAIKMCPLVQEIEKQADMTSVVCLTGQHREMVTPILHLFHTKVGHNLDIMRPKQTLTTITTDIISRIEAILIQEMPDIVLVHGDTTTSFAAALAAFYQQIPVGHVEAGLRSGNRYSPYPEEMNRTLTARLSALHFCPTENNQRNLQSEGIKEGIFITGNTVMDSFATTVRDNYHFHNRILKEQDFSKGKWILMTAHRRENIGKPLENIFRAVKRVITDNPDTNLIFPVHPNPAVREIAEQILSGTNRIILMEPLDVEDMHNLMMRSYLVLTDSGGLQEEAPACGIPVLVLRTETERPEAVAAGTVKMVGIEEGDIIKSLQGLLKDEEAYHKMAMAVNPYGDGQASRYIVEALRGWKQ